VTLNRADWGQSNGAVIVRSVLLQILAFGVGAVVQAGEVEVAPRVEVAPDVRAMLSEPLPESEYTEARNCVSTMAVERTEVLDSSHILFLGRGDRVWINQLKRPCIGLEQAQVLAFDLTNARFCRFDRFRGVDTLGVRTGPSLGRSNVLAGNGPICTLERFEPVSPIHARVIRQALIRRRETDLETEAASDEDSPVEH